MWCDHQVEQAWKMNCSHPDADVLPTEKWAIYSCYPVTRKLTGKLDTGIQKSLYHESLTMYLYKKHNICEAKLSMINMEGLNPIWDNWISQNTRQLPNSFTDGSLPMNAYKNKDGPTRYAHDVGLTLRLLITFSNVATQRHKINTKAFYTSC